MTSPGPLRALRAAGEGAVSLAGAVQTIAASRVVRPIRPDRLTRAMLAARSFGATPATPAAVAAALHPRRLAIADELGELTFGELDGEARRLAGSMAERLGLGAGDRVAVMCRNHRWFVLAALAAGRLGCDLVPLNNDFAAPALSEVLEREGVTAAVHDEEFAGLFDAGGFTGPRIVGWYDGSPGPATAQALIDEGADTAAAPAATGRVVLLTSGTTGTPKGANRSVAPRAAVPLALGGLLDIGRIRHPPRSGDPVLVAPPLFHLFGIAGMMGAFGLGSPIVITRRFDAEAALGLIAHHRVGALLAVPTMLSRIMALPAATRASYDTSSLRMIVSGAAPLSPELALAVMDEFGHIVYNGYASTEVGSGTLATPADLRAAPGTVGRPMASVKVRILDEHGAELPPGRTGRIFIGSPLRFDGYTGGGSKEVIGGLMSTGDVGHFDDSGRLFIDGRDDDMILSGGENVFPQEVEDLLSSHPSVADAAVIGVPDPEFGQRLAARVVLEAGAEISEDELRDFVRERLARHKVPREIEFVAELPRTSTGKLRRRALSESG